MKTFIVLFLSFSMVAVSSQAGEGGGATVGNGGSPCTEDELRKIVLTYRYFNQSYFHRMQIQNNFPHCATQLQELDSSQY